MNRTFVQLMLAGLVASGVGAGEVPASRPEEAGLAAAPRELELIKASRDPANQAKSPGLNLAVPAAPSLEASPVRPSRPTAAPRPGGGVPSSRGWLVDALDRGSPPERERLGVLSRGRASGVDDSRDPPRPDDDRSGSSAPRSSAEQAGEAAGWRPARDALAAERRPEKPPNPFQPFLAGWMSPGDFALLKPVLEQTSGAGAGGTSAGIVPAQGTVPGSAVISALDSRLAVPPPPASARPNPYLEVAVASTPASVAVAPAAPLPAAPTFGPSGSPFPGARAEPTPEPPRTPAFVKPPVDEKLFRGLRRF